MKLHTISKRWAGAAVAAALSSAAFAGFEQIGGKDYWRDDAGTLHQYLYLRGHTSGIGTAYFLAQPTDTTTTPWVAGSVFVASSNLTYQGSWTFLALSSVYGFCFQTNGVTDSYITFDRQTTYDLGAYGIRAERAGINVRTYNTSFNLTESQTWRGLPANSLSSKPLTIVMPGYAGNQTYANGRLTATGEDIKFRLAGDMRLLLAPTNCGLANCDMTVEKPAYLAVRKWTFNNGQPAFEGHLNAHSLTLDGGAGLIFGSASTNTIPILSPDRIAPTVALTNGALLSASADTTIIGGVTIVSRAGAVNYVKGKYLLADNQTVFRADEDGTLDLSGANIPTDGFFALSGSGKIVFADAGRRLDAAQLQDFSGTLEVASGTLYIPRAADIPASVKFETTGSGALCFGDATGFDAETRLSGTSNLLDGSSGLVITDVKRDSVSVGDGETLLVCGNGLDADGTLSLAAGATVLFCETSEIAAPISQSGAVTLVTFSSAVTGTVSGVYTASAGAMTITSPGLLKFTGGGTFYGLNMKSGNAEITHESVTCNGSLNFYGGYLTIKDGGQWYFGAVNWACLYLDRSEQTKDATLEIGPGGYFRHSKGYNQGYYIGKSKTYTSRLYINGGEVRMTVVEPFRIDGNGIVEIDNGGILRTVRTIDVGTGGLGSRCGLILGNGSFCITPHMGDSNPEGAQWAYRGFMYYANLINKGSFPITVKGDFVFDLTSLYRSAITNQSADVTSPWKFEKGGRIHVKGNNKTLFVRGIPHMALDLSTELPAATVKILPADDGEGAPAPQSIEWTIPTNGVTAGTVVTEGLEGQPVPLVASYRVPENAEFSDAAMTGWATGFSDGGVSNLTFESGAAWRFVAFPFSPLALAGSLSLPAELPCTVVAGGPASAGAVVETVATAAEGISGADCAFPCRGVGVNLRNSSIAVDGSSVVLSYASPGFMMILK